MEEEVSLVVLPDFDTMTTEEAAQWLMDNDTSELMRTGLRVHHTFVQVDADGVPVPQRIEVELPGDVVAWLDEHGGRNDALLRAARLLQEHEAA